MSSEVFRSKGYHWWQFWNWRKRRAMRSKKLVAHQARQLFDIRGRAISLGAR